MTQQEHIYKTSTGKYKIYKTKKNKKYCFGTFHTEQEAKERVAFLKKHKWNIKYTRNPPTPGKYPKNIRYNPKYGKYYIQKQIKYQYYYKGLFNTLEEAINERNRLSQLNWDTSLMKKSKKRIETKHYIKTNSGYYVKKSIKNKLYNFGRYDTEEEARERVAFLKKHNWDTAYTKQGYIESKEYPDIHKHIQKGYFISKKTKNKTYYEGIYKTRNEAKKRIQQLKRKNKMINCTSPIKTK